MANDFSDIAQKLAQLQDPSAPLDTAPLSLTQTDPNQPQSASIGSQIGDSIKNVDSTAVGSSTKGNDFSEVAKQLAAQQSDQSSSNTDFSGAALTLAAQSGGLKKEDPDAYQTQVTKAALNPDYDPVNQTAVDKINGQDTKDFNFDVYNARHLKGIETKIPITTQLATAIDNLPQGLADSFANSGFLNRLAESTYQSGLLTPGIMPLLQTFGVNELPSFSGRTQSQNVAENLSSIDTAWQRTYGIAHSFLDNLKQDFGTSYKKMDDASRNNFFDKRVNDEYGMEQAARGQGFLNKDVIGLDKETINPNDVKRDSTFLPIDPLQMAFMKVAPWAGIAGEAAAKGIANQIPEGLQGLVGASAKLAGKGLQGIGRFANDPIMTGVGTTALDFASGDDLGSAIKKGIFAGFTGKVLGSTMENYGQALEGTLPEGVAKPIPITVAEKAWQGAKAVYNSPEGQNAMGGALFAVPLIYAENDPNKKIATAVNSLAAGAAMGTISRLGGLLDVRYASNRNANFYQNIPTTPTDYGTSLDIPNNEAVSRMSQSQRDMLYRQRNIVGPNAQIYVLPDDVYTQQAQNSAKDYYAKQGLSPEEALNRSQNVDSGAIYYGSDGTSKPQIFMKESSFSPDIATHEVGHFMRNVIEDSINTARQQAQDLQNNNQPIPPEIQSKLDLGKQLDSIIPTGRSRKIAEKTYVDQLYNLNKLKSQINAVKEHVNAGNTELQPRLDNLNEKMELYKKFHKEGLPDDVFRDEWLSDQFSLASRGLMSGNQTTKMGALRNGIGTFLDKVSPNAIAQYFTTRQTPLGFRPSFIAGDVFDNWISNRAQEMRNEPPIGSNPQNPTVLPTKDVVATTTAQVDPDLVKTASDTLVGLQVPKRQALARVTQAVESLRQQGADLSKVQLQDIIRESLKGQANKATHNLPENPIDQSEVKPPGGVVTPPPPPIPPTDTPPAPEEPTPPKGLKNIRLQPEDTPPYQNSKAEALNNTLDVRDMVGKHNNKEGLTTATKREVLSNLDVATKDENYLKGSQIDPNDADEMQLVKQAHSDAEDPKAFEEALATVQNAIKNKTSTSIGYNSATNEINGVASKRNRADSQKLSDLNLLPREEVQKDINPYNVAIRTIDEPYMTGNAHAEALQKIKNFKFSNRMSIKTPEAATAALQELFVAKQEGRIPNLEPKEINFLYDKILPSKLMTRMYSNNFSFDKFMGNKKLLSRAIIDSGLQNDPDMARALSFMNSPEFEKDAIGRLNNIASGRRGDGQEIQGMRGLKEVAKNAPEAYPLPDWKVQILNALEGGPSPTYFQEANQNVPQLRGIKVNPFNETESANPFWNKLKGFGDKLKLNETDIRGNSIQTQKVGNILEPANETIRLDRVKSIQEKPVNVPTSTYFNRSIGFSPEVLKRNPIDIDETINPSSLLLPYRMQGLAAARGYENAHKK